MKLLQRFPIGCREPLRLQVSVVIGGAHPRQGIRDDIAVLSVHQNLIPPCLGPLVPRPKAHGHHRPLGQFPLCLHGCFRPDSSRHFTGSPAQHRLIADAVHPLGQHVALLLSHADTVPVVPGIRSGSMGIDFVINGNFRVVPEGSDFFRRGGCLCPQHRPCLRIDGRGGISRFCFYRGMGKIHSRHPQAKEHHADYHHSNSTPAFCESPHACLLPRTSRLPTTFRRCNAFGTERRTCRCRRSRSDLPA